MKTMIRRRDRRQRARRDRDERRADDRAREAIKPYDGPEITEWIDLHRFGRMPKRI
jgi:hypothetical protein